MKKEILFYLTLFLVICLFSTAATAFDNDLWARLIAGMGVIDGGHVLKNDFLSYTPVHTWWDHEWGAGTIFYFFLKYFGAYSLIILQVVMIFLIFFTASKVIKIRTNVSNPSIIFYFFAVMAILCTLNNPVRSHLFSFLFFTIFIYILEKARTGNNKLLFLIPLITVFWNNIHGGVVSGLGLILLYSIGEFLNKKPVKKYLITLVISLPLLLINPWGLDYIKFLLMANTMHRNYIIEWWGIFHHWHLYHFMEFKFYMFAMVIIEFIFTFINIKEQKYDWFKNADKTKYIILLTTLYIAIAHVKMIPFFVITSLCFIYEDFYKIIQNYKFPVWKDRLVYGLLIFVCIMNFSVKSFSLPEGFSRYPVKEIEFVRINNLTGKLFINFNHGSYASYKLYPHNLIFMDGRYEEVYYDYMLPILKKFNTVSKNWDDMLKLFPPDVMIIDKYYPVYNVISNSNDWKLVYEGQSSGVFVPKDNVKQNYIQPSDDKKYYKDTLFNTDIKFRR